MARIVKGILFGDLQAHPWQEQERPDRWKDCQRVINEIYDKATEIGAEFVGFMGDLFEAKRAVRTDIMGAIYRTFIERIEAFDGHTLFVTGNHDIYRDGSTLAPFQSLLKAYVADAPMSFVPKTDGAIILLMPWGMESINDFGCEWDIALTHCDFKGARHSPTHVSDSDNWRDSFRDPEYGWKHRVIFNGHYHHPAELKGKDKVSVVMVGSPMQHDWSDIDGGARGCIEVTIDPGKSVTYKRHEFKFPKFYRGATPWFRDGIDFLLPQLEPSGQVEVETHDGVAAIAGEDNYRALTGYLYHTGIKPPDLGRYRDIGLQLMEGTSYGEAGVQVAVQRGGGGGSGVGGGGTGD